MNERIRELSLQAGIAVNLSSDVVERDTNKWIDIYSEKFAQLIVGHAIECVRDVLRDDSDLSYVAASQVQKRLREFFGVEE